MCELGGRRPAGEDYTSTFLIFRHRTTDVLVQRRVLKNRFDGQTEEPGGPKGQGQARIELAGLDGVDVCRDTSRASANWACVPVCARPVENVEAVLHR